MKLLEQQRPPVRLIQPLSEQSKQSRRRVELAEQTLECPVVAFLIRTACGTAPVQFEIELVLPDREMFDVAIQILEKRTHRS